MRWVILITILVVSACSAFAQTTQDRPPNIIYILADDYGHGDPQCNNPNGKLPTPNIDRLSREGMRFTDAHSSSSVCTPSRYSILTGRYNWRSKHQWGVLYPYEPPLIAPDRMTVPSFLKQHGYHTACIGKWHLGWDWPRANGEVVFDRPIRSGPTTRGFEYYFGTDVPNFPPYCFLLNDRTVGQPTAVKEKQDLNGLPGPMLPGWEFDAILPTLAEKASEYIEQHASEEPFFLYVPLTSPHEPIAPSSKFKGKSGISDLADFMIETDWAVGQILDALDRAKLNDRTLVFFTADNGHADYTGLPALLKAGHDPSFPFRGYKFEIWEGGHCVPLIARWPGKIKAGAIQGETVCLANLLATCAAILDVKLPDNAGEDSFSILPLLRGEKLNEPTHPAVVHHSVSGYFAIRQGKWKLILCSGNGRGHKPDDKNEKLPLVQLYDMSADPREEKNLQAEHPNVVANLQQLLEKYVADGRSTPGPAQSNDVKVDIWKNR